MRVFFTANDTRANDNAYTAYLFPSSYVPANYPNDYTVDLGQSVDSQLGGTFVSTISGGTRRYIDFQFNSTLPSGSYRIWIFTSPTGTSRSFDSNIFSIKGQPRLVLSGSPTVIAGQPALINVTLTGTAPWTFDYNDYSQEYGSANYLRTATVNTLPYAISIRMSTFTTPITYDNVFVRNLRDGSGCPGSTNVTGSATVTSTPMQFFTQLALSTVCSGQALSIRWGPNVANAQLKPDFIPVAQLSDANGSFSNPVEIARGPAGYYTGTSNTLTATIPASTAAGNTYKIRVVSSRSDYNALISPSVQAVAITKVDKPTVANTNPTVCQGDASVTLSATGSGTLRWYDFNGTTQPGAPTQGTGNAGDFRYSVKQFVGACESDKVDIVIKVKAKPGAPGVAAKSICQNGPSYTLEASGSNLRWFNTSDELWNGNGSTPIVSTGSAGPQTFKVDREADGCRSDKATVTVTVNVLPAAPAVTPPPTVCQYVDVPNLTANGQNLNWFTTETGGSGQNTAKPSSAQPGTTAYWVSQIDKGCESARAKIEQTISAASPDPTTAPVLLCKDQLATALTATGTSLKWYNSGNGLIGTTAPIPATNQLGDFTYRVTQNTNGCESKKIDLVVSVKNTPGAPGVADLAACNNATAPTLTANGDGLRWYTVETGGTGTANAPALSTAQVGDQFYWVSQAIGTCEGPRAKLKVVVNALPAAPTATTPAPVCQYLNVPVLAATGQNLKWYRTETGGTAEGPVTPTSTTAGVSSFWVSQTDKGCEGPRLKLDQTINPASPDPTTATVLLCKDQQATALTAGGTGLKWFDGNGTLLGTSAPAPSTAQIGDFIYRVSQTSNGCESRKVDLLVSVRNTPGAPGVAPVSLCQNQVAKLLTATGDGLSWYEQETGGTSQTALTPQTGTLGDKAYWVSQRFGTCEGPRAKLTTTVFAVPAAPVATGKDFCINDPATPLIATGEALRWYTTADRTGASQANVTPTTDRSQNLTYYVTQTKNGCESTTTAVQVRVRAKAIATLTGDDKVFAFDSTAIRIKLDGDGPWSLTLWSGQAVTTSTTPYVKWVTPNPTAATASYKLQALRNDCGPGEVGNNYTLTILTPLATVPAPEPVLYLLPYPSPASSQITLEWQAPAGTGVTLRLVTLLGRVGWQAQRTGTGLRQKEDVDLSQLATGYLILSLQTTDNQHTISTLLKQ